MKKILVTVLAIAMVLSMAACASSKAPETTTAESTTAPSTDTTGAAAGDTFGAFLRQTFLNLVADGSNTNVLDIANAVITADGIPFSGGAMEVVPGLLNGFNNYEVTGFEKGATFGPMITAVPFVGYIFQLADGADVAAFTKNLKENANLRWNVCVEADEMVIETKDNIVFFAMCPANVED